MKKVIAILTLLPAFCFASIGLKIGDKVPDIKLTEISGKVIDLNRSKETVVLVFYRGSWCPYCMTQLKSINQDLAKQVVSKAKLVAISVDMLKVAKKMKDKFNFSFDIVSDPKAISLKAFKIANKINDDLVKKYKNSYKIDVEADSGENHHMVAHPAVFIIKNGKITFADVHEDYKTRTENKDILKAI